MIVSPFEAAPYPDHPPRVLGILPDVLAEMRERERRRVWCPKTMRWVQVG